ncbi:MAG: gliding motility-associated ABC transporter ATP-binding subunit GldA [Bacteroidetes bacterium]|nr:gliding motility-associated ABC transporter ATP-binding subunit GldA [Bacteroidota bacterium]
MSVSVSKLTKAYGAQKAIDSLSFTVSKGEIVGLLGPNGAGKSTTMKILSCYLEPSGGEASVCGLSIYDAPVEVRRKVGYLPEHNPLYLDMYVREFLAFAARLHELGNKSKQRIADMIALTGLGREQHKKLGQLSKGYRQRVGLAQALLHDPEVLILDEPTSGLDPLQIEEIRGVIRSVGREKTVIMSTHIMQEVNALCQRAIIINRGKIVADSPLHELMEQFSGRQALALAFMRPVPLPQLEQLPGVAKVMEREGKYIVYHSNKAPVREAAFQLAVDGNNPILHMEPLMENLEDIFRNLTKETTAA